MKLAKNKFKILYKKRFPCPKEKPILARSGDATRWGAFLVSIHHELLTEFRLINNFYIPPPKGKVLLWPGRGIDVRIRSFLLKNARLKREIKRM